MNRMSGGMGGRLLVAVLGLSLGGTACVTTKEEGDAMRRDLARMQDRQNAADESQRARGDELDKRIKEADEKLREMDNAQRGIDERTARNKADFGAEVASLQSEVARLRGTLETKEYQLKERELQLGASQSSVKELELRVAELERKVKDLENKPAPVAAAPARVEPPPPAQPAKPSFPTERQALYDFAKKSFDDGDYALSREAFEKFCKMFPKDKDLLDNAYFWAGETHFQQKAYDKAILSYQKVISDFPKSEKADAALYKMGQSFVALNFDDDARVFFDELIQKYPKSPLVKDAKARLDDLAKKKKAPAKKK